MKNIKVKHLDDSNSVNVRIEHSTQMSKIVDKLLKLSDDDFKSSIKISRKYRKANKSMGKFIRVSELEIKIESTDERAQIVNSLACLGKAEYRKTIRCAKQYREANKMLDSAISNYVTLAKEDRAKNMNIQRMGLSYE
jgi:hypothetical protein